MANDPHDEKPKKDKSDGTLGADPEPEPPTPDPLPEQLPTEPPPTNHGGN